MGIACQAGAHGIGPHALGFIGSQKQLAVRGEVQRRVTTNGAHHLHAGAFAVGAFHIDDFIALAHAQIHGLLDLLVQQAHGGQGGFAHAQAGFDQVTELQQAHAKAVAAGFGAVHKTACRQVVQDAVCSGGVQAGFLADVFQRYRFFARGQHVDQDKHALQHLYAGFSGYVLIIFLHVESQSLRWADSSRHWSV